MSVVVLLQHSHCFLYILQKSLCTNVSENIYLRVEYTYTCSQNDERKPMVPALKPSLQTPDEDPLIYFCLEGG